MESRTEKLLRLWKSRQTADGHDVSGVKTLDEAEHFFEKEEQSVQENETVTPPSMARNGNEEPEVPENPDEEVTEDEQCDIDPVGEPV